MSVDVLCEAIVQKLKVTLSLPDEKWIDVRPDEQPTSAGVARAFISVYDEGWEYKELNNGISEEYAIGVTVSMILSQKHVAYWGQELAMSWDKSLDFAVRKIIDAVHLEPDILVSANSRLATGISSPFVEMLQARKVDRKVKRGPDWWGTKAEAIVSSGGSGGRGGNLSNPIIGYSRAIHFFGGRRIQGIGNYT